MWCPSPGWDFFPDEDVSDLDESTRARTAPLTRSVPARVPTDAIALVNPARYRVPVTLLMGGLDQAAFEGMIDQWGAYAAEYRAIDDAEVVPIGSGHWPQFSVPERARGTPQRGDRTLRFDLGISAPSRVRRRRDDRARDVTGVITREPGHHARDLIGVANRAAGMLALYCFWVSSGSSAVMSVSMKPGATTLAVIRGPRAHA